MIGEKAIKAASYFNIFQSAGNSEDKIKGERGNINWLVYRTRVPLGLKLQGQGTADGEKG